MKKEDYDVDIIITWVDGSDPKWIAEKNKFISEKEKNDNSTGGVDRYLDLGLLKYIFRGIEKYANWVHKIHFVTWGHIPTWLNKNNPKLNIVKHEEFMPKQFLPTFSGNALSLNFHRINGLAERFIYVNDDMFFLKKTSKSVFFKNGIPCDMAIQDVIDPCVYHDAYYHTLVNDLSLINSIVKKKNVVRKHPLKWFSPKYGIKHLTKNICLSPFRLFTGFYEPHTPAPYMKSTYRKVWELCEESFLDTSARKFRSTYCCTENVIRFYQMATGHFHPINRDKYGLYDAMNDSSLPSLITKQKKNMVCINYYDKENFKRVKDAFEMILPNKSSFEN